MKIQDAKLAQEYRHGYGEGAVPGYGCTVEVQTGERYYEKTTIALPPPAVDRIMKAIAAEVQAMFVIDLDAIDVIGKAGVPRPETAVDVAAADADVPCEDAAMVAF